MYQISEIGMTFSSLFRPTIYSFVLKNNFHKGHQVIVGELSLADETLHELYFLAITELSSLITGQS